MMFRLDGLGTRIADLCIGRDISKRSITSRLAILRMPGRTTARVWRSRLSKLREYCNAIAVPGCRVTSVTEVRATSGDCGYRKPRFGCSGDEVRQGSDLK